MYMLFHVTGVYVYVDPDGKAEKVEDVFSESKLARHHYEKVGLDKDFVSTCCLPPCCLPPSLSPAPRRVLSETLNIVLVHEVAARRFEHRHLTTLNPGSTNVGATVHLSSRVTSCCKALMPPVHCATADNETFKPWPPFNEAL
jgi:hypothetical protein